MSSQTDHETFTSLARWPQLFQNLRATLKTKLAESSPIHVVCEWIGNSQTVSKKHYLQVTAEQFRTGSRWRDAESDAAGVRIDQHGPEWTGTKIGKSSAKQGFPDT
jgi:hypothetical protein